MKATARLENLAGLFLLFASLAGLTYLLLQWGGDEDVLPIFDVQVHYNQDAWGRYSPTAISNTLDELKVVRVAVSSTPNEGTFRLLERAPLRVIPVFRPYREPEDRDTWFHDPTTITYLEQQLPLHDYRAIGEIHILAGHVDMHVVKRTVELALEHNLVLHVHADVRALHDLMTLHPKLRVLWAHAGMTEKPAMVSTVLDYYSNLWVDLSHRVDVAPRGKLDPAWRAVMLRHPDRFMVGTGTYQNEYWYQYRYTIGGIRDWLAQLPPDAAELIAYKNAMALFAR